MMMIRGFCVAVIALRCTAPAGALDGAVAMCDITPDVEAHAVPMAGYGDRKGKPSTGVHDPLHAKVLLLRDGETVIALITSDLRSITKEFTSQILAKSVGLGLTKENLMVTASHTHCGPSMYPEQFWQFQFGAYDPSIVEAMSDAVAAALRQATAALEPVRIGFASAQLPEFTRNRRWGYDTEAREAAGEEPCLNPALWVMRMDAGAGECRGVLVHYATHPTILGADNFLLSAEWPGVAQREVEAAFPGSVAMYMNGAEGDQAPAGATGDDGFARAEDFGTRLAHEAIRLATSIETKSDAPIAYAYTEFPLGEPVFSEAAQQGPYAFLLPSALEALPRAAVVQQFRVGDAVFAALPGEPLCEVGLDVERRLTMLGVKHPVVVGLANDYIGYIVNAKEYAHGGYEVDQRSYYGPSLGERLAKATGDSASRLKK